MASARGGFSVFAEQSAAGDDLGQGKLALSVEDAPGGVVVAAVQVRDARNLKAVLAGLRYDASCWHPESAEFTQALGAGETTVAAASLPPDTRGQVTGPRDQVGAAPSRPLTTDNWQLTTAPDSEVLSLAVLSEPGVVHLAQALPHYATQPGLTTQSAVIARLRFSPGAMRATKTTSSPILDDRFRMQATWDYGLGTLTWYYVSKGDGDQNGVVNLADIIPLAEHFGQSSSDASFGSDLPYNLDGDGNYGISLADLVFISRNFNASALGGFDVFRSTNAADYPVAPDAPNGSGAVRLAHVPFEAGYPNDTNPVVPGDPQNAERRYRADLLIGPGDFLWVRPLDEQGHRGTPSAIVHANDFHPPAGWLNQQALSWSATSAMLGWYYYNCGDYDQNSVVVMRDIYALADHFGNESPNFPDPFPEDSVLSVVDGQTNGSIGLDDLLEIPYHLFSALTGYNVYASANLSDYEACADGESVIAPIGHIAFTAAQGDTMVDRLRFSFHLASPQPGMYCWVRPELWGSEGVESLSLQLPSS